MKEHLGRQIRHATAVALVALSINTLAASKPREAYSPCFDDIGWYQNHDPIVDMLPYPVPNPRLHNPLQVPSLPIDDSAHEKRQGLLKPVTERKLAGAVVKITRIDGRSGSGFITTGRDGERVIVTAAHVVPGGLLDGITIIDSAHNSTTATSGCYIAAGSEHRGDLPPNNKVDIAIIRPRQKIGRSVLTFAPDPQRGERVTFYNFQQNRSPDNPAKYCGLALGLQTSWMDGTVLTGIDGIGSLIEANASGGAIVNEKGDVVSMSVSAIGIDERSLGPITGAYLPLKPGDSSYTVASLRVAGTVKSSTLAYALDHGHY